MWLKCHGALSKTNKMTEWKNDIKSVVCKESANSGMTFPMCKRCPLCALLRQHKETSKSLSKTPTSSQQGLFIETWWPCNGVCVNQTPPIEMSHNKLFNSTARRCTMKRWTVIKSIKMYTFYLKPGVNNTFKKMSCSDSLSLRLIHCLWLIQGRAKLPVPYRQLDSPDRHGSSWAPRGKPRELGWFRGQ